MKLNRLLALLMALMMTFMAVSCAAAEDVAAEVSDADVLVTVNGTEITRGEILDIASNLLYNYSQQGYDTSDQSLVSYVSSIAVEFAIQYALLDQQAAILGYDQFADDERAAIEADANAQWTEIVDMYVSYYGGLTAESTEEDKIAARAEVISLLETNGYSYDILLDTLLENATYERLEADMVAGAAVTEEDVQAYYEELIAQDEAQYANDIASYEYMTQYYGETAYYTPAGYRGIIHILLEVDEALLSEYQGLAAALEEQENAEEGIETTEEPVTQEQVDAAKAAILASVQPTIDDINTRMQSGESFETLITEYGTDPGMLDPANLTNGYAVHMDSIVWDPAFTNAAFSIENIGGWSEPSLGSYGIYIAYYLRDIPAGPVELTEDLKNDLQAELLAQKEDELFTAKLNEWYEAAEITYSEELVPADTAAE